MHVRADSWAACLDEDQQWELFETVRGWRWFRGLEYAKTHFKLERVPKRTAFCDWMARMEDGYDRHRRDKAIVAQVEAQKLADQYNVTDADAAKALQSAAFSAYLLHGDVKQLKDLQEVVFAITSNSLEKQKLDLEKRKVELKEEDLKIAQRRLAIYEQKEASAKKAFADAKLSPEERERKIKEIFGIQ